MWPQKGSDERKNFADQSGRVQEAPKRSESWRHEMSGKETSLTECSLYDSGRTDSGFLSGANILSETYLSGEITPPSPRPEAAHSPQSPCSSAPDPKSYVRLDSGVDVSEQLSELCLSESPNDLGLDSKLRRSPNCDNINADSGSSQEINTVPWEIYFHQDEEGDTQLHIAIIRGFLEIVYSLICLVPNPTYLDIRNDLRQTGLHLAVLTSQPRVVRELVCAGARTDLVDRHGNTPLHLATAAGDLACLRALTDPITVAETLAISLKYAPHQRQPHPPELDMYNYEGLTCVHIAAMNENIDALRHLYWLGADINAREWKSGRSALHMAVEQESERLAGVLLVDMGARPSLTTYAGATPFRLARANPAFVSALVNIGVPHESDYSSSEDDEDDDIDVQLQMMEPPFRDLHLNGGFVNATA